MKIPMYDQKGNQVCDLEVPEDIMVAAGKVADYLRRSPGIAALCGLSIKPHEDVTVHGGGGGSS